MTSGSVPETLAEQCLRGAFDLNCRCAPAPGYAPDPWDAAEEALDLGMGGLVFRDDGYCTAPIAALLAETEFAGKPISLLGGVALNNVSGGINFYAAEHALMLHGRVVSMPTVSAQNHLRRSRWPSFHKTRHPARPSAIAAVNARGEVTANVVEVLEMIAAHDGVLDAGALHVSEVLVVFEKALKLGVKRLLVSDPVSRNGAGAIDIRELAEMGAAIEFQPRPGAVGRDLIELVLEIAPRNLLLGLDAGPSRTLRERYLEAIRFWTGLGLNQSTIKECISSNVTRLLGARPARIQRPEMVE